MEFVSASGGQSAVYNKISGINTPTTRIDLRTGYAPESTMSKRRDTLPHMLQTAAEKAAWARYNLDLAYEKRDPNLFPFTPGERTASCRRIFKQTVTIPTILQASSTSYKALFSVDPSSVYPFKYSGAGSSIAVNGEVVNQVEDQPDEYTELANLSTSMRTCGMMMVVRSHTAASEDIDSMEVVMGDSNKCNIGNSYWNDGINNYKDLFNKHMFDMRRPGQYARLAWSPHPYWAADAHSTGDDNYDLQWIPWNWDYVATSASTCVRATWFGSANTSLTIDFYVAVEFEPIGDNQLFVPRLAIIDQTQYEVAEQGLLSAIPLLSVERTQAMDDGASLINEAANDALALVRAGKGLASGVVGIVKNPKSVAKAALNAILRAPVQTFKKVGNFFSSLFGAKLLLHKISNLSFSERQAMFVVFTDLGVSYEKFVVAVQRAAIEQRRKPDAECKTVPTIHEILREKPGPRQTPNQCLAPGMSHRLPQWTSPAEGFVDCGDFAPNRAHTGTR